MKTTYEVKSNSSLDQTLDNVKEALADRSFGVLWSLNLKSKFKEKGFDYAYDFWVLEVCNPKLAIQVLEKNQLAGYFLPCKISVFDSEDGIQIGLARPTDLIGLVSEDPELLQIAKQVEEILISAIDASVK